MQSANPIIKNILGELVKLRVPSSGLSKVFQVLFENCPVEGLENVSEKEKYAWLAGLIDGEGCIGLYKQNRRCFTYERQKNGKYKRVLKSIGEQFNYYCLLRITNNFFELMITLLKYFRGKVQVTAHYQYGTFTFNWRPEDQNYLREILQNVLPYLVVKKQLAGLLLKAIGLKKINAIHPDLEEIYYQFRQLQGNKSKGGRKKKCK